MTNMHRRTSLDMAGIRAFAAQSRGFIFHRILLRACSTHCQRGWTVKQENYKADLLVKDNASFRKQQSRGVWRRLRAAVPSSAVPNVPKERRSRKPRKLLKG